MPDKPQDPKKTAPEDPASKMDSQEAIVIHRSLVAVLETARQYDQQVTINVTVAISDRR